MAGPYIPDHFPEPGKMAAAGVGWERDYILAAINFVCDVIGLFYR